SPPPHLYTLSLHDALPIYAPYVQGCTHATMAGTKGCYPARVSQSPKAGLSSDWSLQPDSMKSESLVIPDQQRRGEYVPGPCTHRSEEHTSELQSRFDLVCR